MSFLSSMNSWKDNPFLILSSAPSMWLTVLEAWEAGLWLSIECLWCVWLFRAWLGTSWGEKMLQWP